MQKSPDAFRTISEVADWLGVQPHVLRFWESKFSQVKPIKRAGGRRYYRPSDMQLLGGLKRLLHEDGLTIKGAQKVLREQGMAYVAELSQPLDDLTAEDRADLDDAETIEAVASVPEPEPAPEVIPIREEAAEAEAAEPAAKTEDAGAGALPGFLTRRPETVAEPEAEAEPETAETEDKTEDAAEEAADDASPLPSFLRPEAEEPAKDDAAPPPVDSLPSFLQKPLGEDDSVTETDAEPSDALEAEAEAASAPAPRRIDVPDTPPLDQIPAEPAALAAALAARSLSKAQKAEITPLVARLAALRDRLAAAR